MTNNKNKAKRRNQRLMYKYDGTASTKHGQTNCFEKKIKLRLMQQTGLIFQDKEVRDFTGLIFQDKEAGLTALSTLVARGGVLSALCRFALLQILSPFVHMKPTLSMSMILSNSPKN